MNTFQWALLQANEMEEAAAVLVARLADPELRSEALTNLQRYAEPPGSAREREWRSRRDALLVRPEVRSAVAQVGRIERYAIPPPSQ